MATDPLLENYLSTLEAILRPIPVSERAEIVTEIKSHVLEALERTEPRPSLQSILDSLGAPEVVANRYLLERRVPMAKPPIHPVAKWLFAGCFGTFALVVVCVTVIVVKFADFEDNGNLSFKWMNKPSKTTFTSTSLAAGEDEVRVSFLNGKLTFQNSIDRKLVAECRTSSSNLLPEWTTPQQGARMLNLDAFGDAKCTVQVPKDVRLKVSGANGVVHFNEPTFSVEAHLSNGKAKVTPAKDVRYEYQLNTANGHVDADFQSQTPAQYNIQIEVTNGRISHEQ